jgi:hypothetical protein
MTDSRHHPSRFTPISGVVDAMLAHRCARDVYQTSMAGALLDDVYDGIFEWRRH